MKQRVLITGASGFVGYHLIEEALKNNLEVFAAVRQSSKIDHLKAFEIQYTYPNFADVNELKAELLENKYDYVIHAAGITKAKTAGEYELINAGYTRNLAQAISESGVKLKKFVLVSSLATLGPLNTLQGALGEENVPHPLTAYAKSKLLGENHLKAFPVINYTILRPTGVYGPRDKDIFIFFKQVAKGIEPYIGRKEQKLSFIYVSDLAKVAIQALHAGDRKTYNLSDGYFYDRYALADQIKQSLGIKTLRIHLPLTLVKIIAFLSEKIAHTKNQASALNVEKLSELNAVSWFCSIERAKADLGFYPEHDLASGVRETLEWYKTNKWL